MKDITDKEFEQISRYIKDNYGISLSDEKKSLLYARLRPVIQGLQLDSFSEYFEYMKNDKTGAATTQFIDKITTNHTYFMRESDHFDYFRQTVLPWIESTEKNDDLRMWCAASSSGEEPYTLQIIIHDYFGQKITKWNTQMLATDISESILNKAQNGIYSNEQLKTMPDNWRKTYFKKYDNDNMIVEDRIKKDMLYRKFNLMEPSFPFKKKFHTIFCRNVMIYFDAATRDELVKKFYEFTEPGGYLFIGHSETLNYSDSKYKYIMPAVYRKL